MNRRPVRSHHQPYDSLGGAMPAQFTYPLPAERIRSTVDNAIARLRAMCDRPDAPEWVRKETDRLILALWDVPSDADAIKLTLDREREDMKSVLESNYKMAHEITELRTKLNADASTSASIQIPLTREPHRAASGE